MYAPTLNSQLRSEHAKFNPFLAISGANPYSRTSKVGNRPYHEDMYKLITIITYTHQIKELNDERPGLLEIHAEKCDTHISALKILML